jgi:Tol biopolymer transport system component
MKLNRLDVTAGGVLAALGLVFGIFLVGGDRIGARVTRLFPAAGEAVGAYSPVGIEFAQAMNAASVEGAFHLTPDVPGQFHWEGQTLWFVPNAPLPPGPYSAWLTGGESLGGRPIGQPPAWSFSVRTPQVIFMSVAADGGHELWRVALDGGAPLQLTHTHGRVYDYDVAQTGETAAYSVTNDQGGTDLWQMGPDGNGPKVLVTCGPETCSMPAWAPSGARLAYIRQPAAPSGQPRNTPRLWTVEPASGQTAPLYQDPQVSASEPSWSPNGQWLVFFDLQAAGLRLLNVQTSASFVLPSLMGQVGSWSSDSTHLAFADIKLGGPQIATILQIADLQAQSLQLVLDTDRGWSDYGPPAWSPADNWLALSLRTADSGAGKQIWLMRPDGSEAHALTHTPTYTHGSYHWDPSGKALLFQRYDLGAPDASPEVMLWPGPGSGEPRRLATGAALPRWLP